MTASEQTGVPMPLPARAVETTPARPWPVRFLSAKIADYIHRMPGVWVEGQVVQLSRRPGTTLAFLTLRDVDADVSLPVSMHAKVLDQATAPVTEGSHVVIHATPSFWAKRGSLQLQADEIRAVGIGELLARIEHLRRVLAAEGLFDADRKLPLPFLPRAVGLICGRESKAEHDVVVNARARWPQVEFEIREVAVQGTQAVGEVRVALAELDRDPRVEVIVIARGGGSVEDLLPFSNEALVRAAAACRTPIVSAIGHETDAPLLDLVADHRASTPTDAAKRVVPDVGEERAKVVAARGRVRTAVTQRIRREGEALAAMRSRPALARPLTLVEGRTGDIARLRAAAARSLEDAVRAGDAETARLGAQVRALSPAATLERGYAVVQRADDGTVVRSPGQVTVGDRLRLRVAEGELAAVVDAGAEGSGPGELAAVVDPGAERSGPGELAAGEVATGAAVAGGPGGDTPSDATTGTGAAVPGDDPSSDATTGEAAPGDDPSSDATTAEPAPRKARSTTSGKAGARSGGRSATRPKRPTTPAAE